MSSLCIHGHFYQPSREDPISDIIPDEKGAEPFQNWNLRILAECYRPNALAGNFEKISFNIGPTLLKWMKTVDPETVKLIIDQERKNFLRFGVGNGMAQGYNHIILPLASYRDKVTQIKWGIADFVHYFGHQPSGFWLPETAVDLETLSILSDCGIEFTILAPWQAKTQNIDTSKAYVVNHADQKKQIKVFFYERDLSTAISFDSKTTSNGDAFLNNIKTNYDGNNSKIIIAASDGELYGHHKLFRDLFLRYILTEGAHRYDIQLSFPALWLREHEASESVQILENTSWSCHHGVARWGEGCECTAEARWKKHLRDGLNALSQLLDQVFESYINQFSNQCWAMRDKYVDVLHEATSYEDLIKSYIPTKLSQRELQNISFLLKAQYERLRMFTSCGFFFEDFHRIEPQNNVSYAAMAVWLTKLATGVNLEDKALQLLKSVRSSKSGLRADTVFSQTWIRAIDNYEDFSDFSKMSTKFDT